MPIIVPSHIVLIAGQSNAAGGEADATGLLPVKGIPGSYWTWSASTQSGDYYDDLRIRLASGIFGPERQCGIDLEAAGKHVGFVQVALGGASITAFTNPTAGIPQGSSVRQAYHDSRSRWPTQRYSFVWIQGENEGATSQAAAEAYQGQLQAFLDDLDTYWGAGSVHTYVVQLHADFTGCAWRSFVRSSQAAVCALQTWRHLIVADAISDHNAIHYLTTGMLELGALCAATILATEYP